jgi:hypothetical protein
MKLMELYNLYLQKYQKTGLREKPDKLLAMLLLSEKDKYQGLTVGESAFYNTYQTEIDQQIAKVEKDFNITPKDINHYIKAKELNSIDPYYDKVWNVFAEGFGALHWSQMYYPNMSPMNAYIKYYGKNDILNINKTKQLVRQHSKIK